MRRLTSVPGRRSPPICSPGSFACPLGVDDFGQFADTHHAWSFKLGLADLNGLTYWALRFIGG